MEPLYHYIGFFAQYLLPAIGAGLTVWIFAIAEIQQRSQRIEALERYIDFLEESLDQAHERELDLYRSAMDNNCIMCGQDSVADYGGVCICTQCGANQSEFEEN